MLKVLLADNEPIFTTALLTVLNSLPNYEVAAVIPNVDKLDAECEVYKPDIVIMRSFFFYKTTGFVAAKKLKASQPEIKIIMMLDLAKQAQVEEALHCQVDACVLRSSKASEFVDVIWKVSKGETVYPKFAHQNMWGPYKVKLTTRELDIVQQLCQNNTYEDIATILGVSKRTVTFHVGNIVSKTGHKNVTGLILEAAHKGYPINWFTEADELE